MSAVKLTAPQERLLRVVADGPVIMKTSYAPLWTLAKLHLIIKGTNNGSARLEITEAGRAWIAERDAKK